MLQTFGNHAQPKCLYASHGLVPILTVGHNAGQRGDFGEPTAVVFSLNFNRERHKGNVPSGPTGQQVAAPDASLEV